MGGAATGDFVSSASIPASRNASLMLSKFGVPSDDAVVLPKFDEASGSYDAELRVPRWACCFRFWRMSSSSSLERSKSPVPVVEAGVSAILLGCCYGAAAVSRRQGLARLPRAPPRF